MGGLLTLGLPLTSKISLDKYQSQEWELQTLKKEAEERERK